MRIIDPQSATLSNIEVLAHITSHPPRRPPNPPLNTNPRNFTPSPDLRDHNTVIKEIHNYVSRLSPHLLGYPRYVHEEDMKRLEEVEALVQGPWQGQVVVGKGGRDLGPTEMDRRLGGLVRGLRPFGLTKGEVLVILNLGVGFLQAAGGDEGQGGEQGESEDGEGQMEVDQGQGEVNGVEGEEGQEEGEGELPAEDYGALALLDTVIEEREERLSNEDVAQVLAVIREALGPGSS